MNVLITGGAGFIGSHLAERCLLEGWRVAVLDDLSAGSLDNLKHIESKTNFSFRYGSILREPLMAELVDRADLIFHLAAVVGVKQTMEHPLHMTKINVDGTRMVLKCAAKKKKTVLLASTSEVYGRSVRLPFRESDNPEPGPPHILRWAYAYSKLQDESLAMSCLFQNDLPVTVMRFFNTVGPRQIERYGMVLPTLVHQALSGEPLTVHETGEQRRCFSYVGDVIEAVVRLAQTPAAIGEIVNIGNDQETSINQLAALVKDITGSPSPVKHVPYLQAYGPGFEDMPRRIPCLEKLERLIHYRPTTPIENIVRRAVDHEWVKMRTNSLAAAV